MTITDQEPVNECTTAREVEPCAIAPAAGGGFRIGHRYCHYRPE